MAGGSIQFDAWGAMRRRAGIMKDTRYLPKTYLLRPSTGHIIKAVQLSYRITTRKEHFMRETPTTLEDRFGKSAMRNTGVIYRPPFEANSLLLEVTTGCSHNQCAFCSMYTDVPFHMCPLEQVEEDLEEFSRYRADYRRAFLENGDAFVLPAERLLKIADLIHARFPSIEVISMYASIPNIRGKTDAELKALRAAGINELNVGVESGYDPALRHMNKGYTAEEARVQIERLTAAGIDCGLNIILGIAGADRWRDNAEATAELLNQAQPYLLFLGTLHAEPGCRLYEEMESGAFRESTYGQLLDEQELLLRRLRLRDTYYFGAHPSNIIPMRGNLPVHRDAMLEAIQEARIQLKDRLDQYPLRGGEGSILLR